MILSYITFVLIDIVLISYFPLVSTILFFKNNDQFEFVDSQPILTV